MLVQALLPEGSIKALDEGGSGGGGSGGGGSGPNCYEVYWWISYVLLCCSALLGVVNSLSNSNPESFRITLSKLSLALTVAGLLMVMVHGVLGRRKKNRV